MRGANYNSVLNVCADAEGIHVSTIILFAIGNSPFSVPWPEISGHQRQGFLQSAVELRFQRVPDVPMTISINLANQLVQASDGMWQYEKA